MCGCVCVCVCERERERGGLVGSSDGGGGGVANDEKGKLKRKRTSVCLKNNPSSYSLCQTDKQLTVCCEHEFMRTTQKASIIAL